MFIPGEYIVSADTAILGVVLALGVALARTRERVAHLEGRLQGLDHDDPPEPPPA